MLRKLTTLALTASLAAPLAFATPPERPGRADNRLSRIDYRLDQAEKNGRWEQGSRADLLEDRFDRFEDRVDRREDRRDRAVDNGWRDRAEDRVDRFESRVDRRENRWDRNQ